MATTLGEFKGEIEKLSPEKCVNKVRVFFPYTCTYAATETHLDPCKEEIEILKAKLLEKDMLKGMTIIKGEGWWKPEGAEKAVIGDYVDVMESSGAECLTKEGIKKVVDLMEEASTRAGQSAYGIEIGETLYYNVPTPKQRKLLYMIER